MSCNASIGHSTDRRDPGHRGCVIAPKWSARVLKGTELVQRVVKPGGGGVGHSDDRRESGRRGCRGSKALSPGALDTAMVSKN